MTIIHDHPDMTTLLDEQAERTSPPAEAAPDTAGEPPDPPRRSSWVGWALVGAAGLAVAGLAVALVAGNDEPVQPAVEFNGDVKDHPNFGPVTPVVGFNGDVKDHPNFGPVSPAVGFNGDVKDHPNYGPVTPIVGFNGDAKDHPNYGPVAACHEARTSTAAVCQPAS